MSRGLFLARCSLLVLLVAPGAARANGNVSHLWVTLWARDELPQGELKDLLTRDDLDLMLRNGANFPDGGYAVNDGYGEIAHWEPFQTAYLDWIVDSYEPPWTDEAAQHIAFLMGMASHGMSDQVYDSMYVTRAGVHDEGAPGSSIGLDGSTDVALAAEVGGLQAPELWVPDELMAQLMVEQMGHEVSAGTIRDGQALVAFSLYWVSEAAADPDVVAEHLEAYPWACTHQMDEAVPGSPPTTAPVVAAYWERLWQRLHGEDPLAAPLLAQFPPEGSMDHPTDPDDVESMVSFVVARGLYADTVDADTVAVEDEAGEVRPVDAHVYYGQSSHVVNLRPTQGWAELGAHVVTVGPGLQTWDGLDYDGFEFRFVTGVDGGDPPPAPEDCSCRHAGGVPLPAASMLILWSALAYRRR